MIELSILAHPADVPFFEITVRHQLRHFANCAAVDRRVILVDLANAQSTQTIELVRVLAKLVAEGHVDSWLEVDWQPDRVRATMERWFGDPDTPPRAARGRPRYQYAYSLDVAERDAVLHLDSDVLFWGTTEWLERSIATFAADADAVAVVPMAGAPQAASFADWVIGSRRARLAWAEGRHVSHAVTTRHVVLHRSRLAALLPLDASGDQHFESSLSAAMKAHAATRITDVDDRSLAWHPHIHNAAHARATSRLISLVDAGDYPFRRWGKPWDITTEGWKFLPWQLLAVLRRIQPSRQRSIG